MIEVTAGNNGRYAPSHTLILLRSRPVTGQNQPINIDRNYHFRPAMNSELPKKRQLLSSLNLTQAATR